eukprot:GHVQ01006872.1.p1 GENE.GHVQ01006872.1~~GHVQ01006872.1.p1  ORF type:complete len:298 (+),score=40.60 GHVQ01006872.1:138-1031(+)
MPVTTVLIKSVSVRDILRRPRVSFSIALLGELLLLSVFCCSTAPVDFAWCNPESTKTTDLHPIKSPSPTRQADISLDSPPILPQHQTLISTSTATLPSHNRGGHIRPIRGTATVSDPPAKTLVGHNNRTSAMNVNQLTRQSLDNIIIPTRRLSVALPPSPLLHHQQQQQKKRRLFALAKSRYWHVAVPLCYVLVFRLFADVRNNMEIAKHNRQFFEIVFFIVLPVILSLYYIVANSENWRTQRNTKQLPPVTELDQTNGEEVSGPREDEGLRENIEEVDQEQEENEQEREYRLLIKL